MRIAVVSPYSVSLPGGVQTQAKGLAHAYRVAGHDVLLVAPVDDESEFTASGDPEIAFVAAGRSLRIPVNGSLAPVSLAPRAARSATRAIAAFAPDVVHLHEPFAPAIGPALLARSPAPIVGTFHRSGTGLLYRGTAPIARVGFRRLRRAIAVSDAARSTLVDVVGSGARGTEIITNGVALDRFAAVTAAASSPPAIVFVGRLEPRKGLEVLLEALRVYRHDVRCWIIGEGGERDELRQRFIGDTRIEWLGALPDNEVAARLCEATLFVAPSLRGESFGVVLLEAMAAGTAVLASDLPGYRLAAGDAARYFPAGDHLALATAMGALVDDEHARFEMITQGHLRAQTCSFENVAALYLRRFSDAIARPARARRHGVEGEPS